MVDEIRTIAKPHKTEIKIKNSKFIGFAFESKEITTFENELDKIRKEHYLANHNCFSYRIGNDGEKFRYSDDGEPSGTAGKPIFTVLENSGLTNLGLIVTRYFGGTKLGTGGLIKAYTESAKITLESAKIKTEILYQNLEIEFDYALTSVVMRSLDSFSAKMIDTFYSNNVRIHAGIRLNSADEFSRNLQEKCLGNVLIKNL